MLPPESNCPPSMRVKDKECSEAVSAVGGVAKSLIVCGSTSSCNSQPALVSVSSPHGVRCCSDTMIPNWKKSSSCAVWTETEDSDGNCNLDVDYFAAENICNKHGARLCTQQELEDDCTQGTGCMLDHDRVWSLSTVRPDCFVGQAHPICHKMEVRL